ncbi:unnamed protein product [Linum tenue]|uniref:Ripening-related protein 1 n=2 Tax=Linum tenue TaxID=586396 RepID=A0AAV0HHS8_9ROSI|nr:unnamed protein product [Linum tenue]
MRSRPAAISVLLFTLVIASCLLDLEVEAKPQTCLPSGKLRGRKPPPKKCNQIHNSDCCVEGKMYTTYECSPPITGQTKAVLTLNSFEKGQDGGGASECDNKFHGDGERVVALSSGWFDNRRSCLQRIKITAGNGRSVVAKVVDECDSTEGCDEEHDYQPPCPNNVVDASPAVWDALGVPSGEQGDLKVTWSFL